jgi:hypothetical protein
VVVHLVELDLLELDLVVVVDRGERRLVQHLVELDELERHVLELNVLELEQLELRRLELRGARRCRHFPAP